jgi:AcrR family transcriptional regulator
MTQTRRAGRPTAVDSADTRRRILDAARAHFASDGYRSTTNRRLADDVGITPAALYHYFESKSELYAAVYCDAVESLYSEFDRVAASQRSLLGKYRAVLRRASELQIEDPTLTGFIVAVALERQRQPDLIAMIGRQRGRHAKFFGDLVDDAAGSGELRPDVDRQALADVMGALVTGLARMTASAGDPHRYTAAVDVLDRFFDGSLTAGATSSRA